jgi:hypothetical protein
MPLDIGTGTTNTPDIRMKFGEAPSGSNVTWSITAYIPIVPFFAIREVEVSGSNNAKATKINAGLIVPPVPISYPVLPKVAKSTAALSCICNLTQYEFS